MVEHADLRDQVARLTDEREARSAEVEGLKLERRQLEEHLLDRDIAIEELERQLVELRDKPTAPAEPNQVTALKSTLKAERERRRVTETHLRRLLSA